MFEIDRPPNDGTLTLAERAAGLRVIDYDSGAVLRHIGGFGLDEARLFTLTWGDRTIPIIADLSKTRTASHWIFTYTIRDFGRMVVPSRDYAVQTYEFESFAEREQALAMAVEAILVYGHGYSGPAEAWDTTFVVTGEGEMQKVHSLESIGYPRPGGS